MNKLFFVLIFVSPIAYGMDPKNDSIPEKIHWTPEERHNWLWERVLAAREYGVEAPEMDELVKSMRSRVELCTAHQVQKAEQEKKIQIQ